jgi:hypothetical protein
METDSRTERTLPLRSVAKAIKIILFEMKLALKSDQDMRVQSSNVGFPSVFPK